MKRRSWLYLAGGISLVVLIVVVDRAEDVLPHIEYPFDVWRMDLDDALANIGFFLVGVAAFATLWKKTERAHAKSESVAKQINGGMSSLAAQVINDELRQADVEVGLWRRVDALEQSRQDCLDELALIKAWVGDRLDETGKGREEQR